MPTPDPAPFANPFATVRAALSAYLPPARVTVAEYAARHRWLDNAGGGYVGRWNHDEAPYLIEPMEALTSREHLSVAIPGPGRCGKTAIAENWLLQSVGADPADILFYEATDSVLEAYVKSVINPMIDTHDVLSSSLGRRPVDNSLHFKKFRGMRCEFLVAAESNLRNKSAPRIVLDEIDGYSDQVADAYNAADLRRQTFGAESKILAISHADQASGLDPANWNRGIMRLYAQSDRRTWWWPCPHCGEYCSPTPTASRAMVLHYNEDAPLDDIRDHARLLCPNGCLVDDRDRRAMNLDGKWVAEGQEIARDGTITGERISRDIAGFWIVGVMSPFVIGGIGALAREKVRLEREAQTSGDDKPLREFHARRLGIPYDPRARAGAVDAVTLADRAEPYTLRTVPAGARFLTAFADVQNNRFELMVRGWGIDGESWIVDVQTIAADTATSPHDWDALIAALGSAYPLADGSGREMRVLIAGYDSGGAPGVTMQAYAAWRRARARRIARYAGKMDGRDVYSLVPTKGANGPNAPRMLVTYPNSKRKDRDARATGAEPLLQFAPNKYKDDLAGQLARADAGAWRVHFPDVLRASGPPYAWFEQLCAEAPNARGIWSKIRPSARNEALDLMVGTHALAELRGLRMIDWTKPPPWAAEWDHNPMVGEPTIAAVPTPGPRAIVAPTPVAPAAKNPAASRYSRMA